MMSGMRLPSALFHVVLFCVLSCTRPLMGPVLPNEDEHAEVEADDDAPPNAPDSLARIDDMAAWNSLAFRPEYQGAAHTEVVKVVIDLAADWRVYFTQTQRYELHYGFVKHRLDPSVDHAIFNRRQYRSDDRDYVLGSLVHYLDGDHWTYEIVAGDTIDAERLARTFALLKERVFFGERLRFRPLSPLHESRIAELEDPPPIIDASTLAADTRYQAPVPGTGYGYLRIVHGPLDIATVRPNEILVVDHVPGELPPVSGLVTGALQAPLAHVAVLSRNRNTPDMALRGATSDERFTAHEGRLVRIDVGPQDFSIRRAERSDAERYWASRRPAETFTPEFDLSVNGLRDVCELDAGDTPVAGAKASQLGVVCAMGDIPTPGGFVVPFFHYETQLHRAGLADSLRGELSNERFVRDASVRAERLATIRERIMSAPVPTDLVEQIRRRIRSTARGRRWIFRSSTNAEDLAGFNGAGLYQSVVVDANPSSELIANALREVWASVWLQRGFEERDWFRIEQAAVKMAVLIQPFVEVVRGNGVAITRNPFDAARPAVYLNVQTQGGSVTGAEADELPEEVLIYTWTPEFEFHVLGRSSRNGGQPILTEAELTRAGDLFKRINDRLTPTYGGDANAVDIEFLFTEAHELVVVQARPILIRYTPGQGWRQP